MNNPNNSGYANIYDFDYSAKSDPAYAEVLHHIYDRLDLERVDPSVMKTVNRDLKEYSCFLESLGNPHLDSKTIHITGTKGKGSVLSILEAILNAGGYKTGSTISPHLMEVRERIRINAQSISTEKFARYYNQIKPLIEKRSEGTNGSSYRTVFELIIALAFQTFREEKVDAALVEVGLGGRLDATNVVDPVLSIITHIGLDHTKVLGDTTGKIAWDKAHIIKPNRPGVISFQPEDALKEIKARRKITGSEVWSLAENTELKINQVDSSGGYFDLTTPRNTIKDLHVSLLGKHQVENAALAVLAADRLTSDKQYDLSEDNIREGLEKVKWSGRGEVLQENPVIILDGAHTPQGACALEEMLKSCWPNAPRVMLLGFNRDKDVRGFLSCFGKKPKLALATAASTPRALAPGEVREKLVEQGWNARTIELANALNLALDLSEAKDIIIITGSLYLVGAIRREYSKINSLLDEKPIFLDKRRL